jgi:hypothetical protein
VKAAFGAIDVLGLKEEEKVEGAAFDEFQSTALLAVRQATRVHITDAKRPRSSPRTFRRSSRRLSHRGHVQPSPR